MHFLVRGILFCLLLSSCGPAPYRGETWGADEFVIDSYQIKEGKLAILEMEGNEPSQLSSDLLQEYQDAIREGDVLEVLAYGNTSLKEVFYQMSTQDMFQVQGGKVNFPEAGEIELEGLSLEAARSKIQKKYHHLALFVKFKKRPYAKVELAGLVQNAEVFIDGKIRLFEVLSMAKMPVQANLFKSYVVRDEVLLPIDLHKLVKEGDMSQNIVMRPGDKVYIAEPSSASVMVLGEVAKPVLLDLTNGFMTLKEALAKAGGMPYTADKGSIQVIRGNLIHPKIYNLTWKHIVELPNNRLLLMPGDIVYVAAAPITQWNRFVSQVLPTLVGIKLFTKHTQGVGITLP